MIEFFLVLLLSIPLLLIRIGDGVRSVATLIGAAIIGTWWLLISPLRHAITKFSHKLTQTPNLKSQITTASSQKLLGTSQVLKTKYMQLYTVLSQLGTVVFTKAAAFLTASAWFLWVCTKLLLAALWVILRFTYQKLYLLTTMPLPRITLPTITFPLLRFPQIPTIQLPHIKLPQVTISLPKTTGKNTHNLQLATDNPQLLSSYRPPSLALRIARLIATFMAGVVTTLVFIFVPFFAYQWLAALPNPQLLSQRNIQVSTKIFDRNDVLLYEIYADQNRTPKKLSEIPAIVQQATIAIEDREFYRHQGFSVRGIARAARETFLNKRVQGGSTITQQLIKSALLTPEQSYVRKTKEIILAFWAEHLYTKNQILEMYLNQVPYGGTAWGIESASQTYFAKPVQQLTLAEAALLAGLPAAPSEYSPFGANPQKAYERQKVVLRRMAEDGYISQQERQDAENQQLTFTSPRVGIRAPHFVMYVKDILEKQYGTRKVEEGGLRVKTSLDITLQEKVQQIVTNEINTLERLKVGNGAAVITNPKTGDILAMVGSRDYFDTLRDGNVNVTTAFRQPGSSIKVVTYAAALENGFTPATLIDDSPVVYRIVGAPDYAPVNYDGKFRGMVPLRYALGNSLNIPAVKTLAKIGVQNMIDKGRLMGITTWEDESRFGLSLTLGGGEVTMLDMANVYGTLANSGKRVALTPILSVTDYTGQLLQDNSPKPPVAAVNPDVAWLISSILSDNQARTWAFGPNSTLVVPGKTVSVKTGTTNDKRDNWTAGYTPSYVTVVWVGNNDNTPMDPNLASGITGAAPIWQKIMLELVKDKPDEVPAKPDSIVELPCYFGKKEYFVKGTEPASGSCAPLPTPKPTPTP